MANGHGGARPNSGPKTDKKLLEFRRWLREEFDTEKWRTRLMDTAKSDLRCLLVLLSHAYGQPPQTVKLEVEQPEATRTVVFPGGDPIVPTTDAPAATTVPASGVN